MAESYDLEDVQPDGGRADETGQGLAEYALILAFVALVCVTALSTLGTTLAGSAAWTIP